MSWEKDRRKPKILPCQKRFCSEKRTEKTKGPPASEFVSMRLKKGRNCERKGMENEGVGKRGNKEKEGTERKRNNERKKAGNTEGKRKKMTKSELPATGIEPVRVSLLTGF